MLPEPGEYVCYFPLDFDIHLNNQDEPVVDAFNRYRGDRFQEVIWAPEIVEYYTSMPRLDIFGIGFWGDLIEGEEGDKDLYSITLTPSLNSAINVCQRELLAYWAALDPNRKQNPPFLWDILDIRITPLESVEVRPDLEMKYSLFIGIDDPDQNDGNNALRFSSESRVWNWILDHQDEIVAGLLTNAAVDTASYFILGHGEFTDHNIADNHYRDDI